MLAGNCGVPLNCMCSTQCETPVRPWTSSREPTRYHSQEEMIGAVCISFRRTLRPLESVVCVREFSWGDEGVGVGAGFDIWMNRPARRSGTHSVRSRQYQGLTTCRRPTNGSCNSVSFRGIFTGTSKWTGMHFLYNRDKSRFTTLMGSILRQRYRGTSIDNVQSTGVNA